MQQIAANLKAMMTIMAIIIAWPGQGIAVRGC